MIRSLTVLFALLAIAAATAAPAQATLLVRSDSTGLLVQDKNGLGDRVVVASATQGGNPVYVVINNNAFDVFKFDRQAGCSEGSTDNRVVCQKISTKLNLAMAGGDDVVNVSTSGAASASVNLSDGNDTYQGLGGPDNVLVGKGDNVVATSGGNDDITLRTGEDRVSAGAGNDEIDKQPFFDTKKDAIDAGSGNDVVSLQSTGDNSTYQMGSGNDIVNLVSIGDDIVDAGPGADNVSTGEGNDTINVKEPAAPSTEDKVNCGQNSDFVTADLIDKVSAISDPGGGTCEEVDRSPVGETPHVKLPARRLRVSASGVVRARLRCPRGVRRLGCRGSLQLALARRARGSAHATRSRRVRYRIRAARSRTVAVKLSRRDVRALRSTRRRRGVLVSVEAGRIGPKTTVRNPRLAVRR